MKQNGEKYREINEDNFRSWNEDMIDKYDPEIYHTKSNLIIRIVISMMSRVMIKMLRPERGDMMIEVGCGAGNIIEKMPPVKKLIGMDISMKLLARTRIRIDEDAGLVSGNAEQLPFKAMSFNKVLCTEVIEHLLSPEKCLSELHRIARDDAKIVITTTNEDFLNKLKSLVWRAGIQQLFFREDGYMPEKKMDDEWHIHAYNPQKFILLLEKYFNLVKVSYVPSYFFPIQIIVRCEKKGS